MADAHGVARDQLRTFIERIERLEEERKTIADDIKDIYAEAKSLGFIPKTMKRVVALRKQDADERAEEQAILDTYLVALGMQPDLFDREAA
jgi:uncharacterized protein (UPF0335 family)